MTVAASEAGSTLDISEQRIVVFTLCYVVYDLMTDKVKMYKLAEVSNGVGASAGLETQLCESDVNLYRYGSFA